MEVYAIFRESIAQERIARDRSVRMGAVSDQITAMATKLNYVEQALTVLVKHMLKAEPVLPAPRLIVAQPIKTNSIFHQGHGNDFPSGADFKNSDT